MSALAEIDNGGVYERYNLYVSPDKLYIEPCDRFGGIKSYHHLQIDRHSNAIGLVETSSNHIPVGDCDIFLIYGIIGTIQIVSGQALIVVKSAEVVGQLNGHDIWKVLATEVIPFKKTTLHLTEKQNWFNRQFTEMLHSVLGTAGFYFSYTADITHSFQWMTENATPQFYHRSLIDRAEERFTWNGYCLQRLRGVPGAHPYCLPIMHGFFGSVTQQIGPHRFKLILVSRRSIQRAGVRFYKRGVNSDGHCANFVETEQIVEVLRDGQGQKTVTAFLQTRGSIPLFWSQRPNLRWQPCPMLRPTDDQLQAYVRHFKSQAEHYRGKQVIVNLVNSKGRERRVGGELERISLQANLPFVRYNPFDFHKECHAMNWDRISVLKGQLRPEITQFGFFAVVPDEPSGGRMQQGIYRTNCMDCLDRTNVVQSMIARESLTDQLMMLGILSGGRRVEDVEELERVFKFLWADNGDECSRQYAGTGALKADFTRLGKRTYGGAMNDGVNAITRYFKNNFNDGYRQDSIDLFLGNFRVDPDHLPSTFETTILALDYHGVAIVAAAFAVAMVVLCLLVSENLSATLFWLAVVMFCLAFIFFNGEEFVNTPKLKQD
ncbi:hypothetical protein PENTCL1PPCAC_23121 [Pristionchus entomophagus]|uniref:Phosphatidylinositol-3-phosphatase SAC1 n=1 Tax=Pristionchus entomophagus TaxID=358040 RepID=A0AAV5U369_9BILA|nr:hypothetical protein PENTCL1PPCAC_23121 [Pristionchus entomophagus]